MSSKLLPGLYEHPLTCDLEETLDAIGEDVAELARLDPAVAPELLARLIHDRLLHSLASLPAKNRLEHQLRLANRIIDLLAECVPSGGAEAGDRLSSPGRLLLEIRQSVARSLARAPSLERPHIPLSTSDLLVNAHRDLSVGPEIRRELKSADRVDLLCSFLKWNGYRVLEGPLQEFLDRNPGKLRVLTTTYIGATERRALDRLVERGARIKVSYDTGRTRLHAKAWMFHRDTGFSTAYIGSSNLSAQALLDGLEWNVRLAKVDNAPILEKFAAAFEQYWADSEFEPYGGSPLDRERFDRAIRRERKLDERPGELPRLALNVDVVARPHQQEILDDLEAERARGHYRNLVVAATGTGKTVVAALDYRRLCERWTSSSVHSRRRPTLLFVAHREEILRQSLQTFQLVLRDSGFGELLVRGAKPEAGRHVFASVQSLHGDRLRGLASDAYEVCIVDEFHHAAADTYERLLDHLRPQILLGLTATPERADGKSILHHFEERIASELRLWKALDQGLLSPFQYFGLKGPDLRHVRWTRGRYQVAELRNVYTADHALALRVIQEVRNKIAEVRTMKALGFCVDVEHARFMADRFNEAGIRARAIWGDMSVPDQRSVLQELRSRAIQVVFSVELLNEGVDLPDVDTIIFLRPTESATLFLQQMGRGLRRSDDKSCCTVLDFIGTAHRRFRFDRRFRAIVGGTRRNIQRQVQEGFPRLPSGCSIVLDRSAQQAVLENIEHQLGKGQRGLVEDLQSLGPDVGLRRFLDETGFELEDVYERSGCSFTALRQKAGFVVPQTSENAKRIERSFARLLHLDDSLRIRSFQKFLSSDAPPDVDADDATQRMLFVLLGWVRSPYSVLGNAWNELWRCAELRSELLQLLGILEDRSRRLTIPLSSRFNGIPLQVHAAYALDEVMAAFDVRNKVGGVMRIQTGVYRIDTQACDLFFVTLEKSESDYTPTTLYQDYPIAQSVFHWESQSSCHENTATGRRYVRIQRGSGDQALLFVRQRRKDDRGETMPYMLLGPVYYRTHQGGRPMQIEWELEHPMPAREFQEMKIAAG